MNIRYEYTALYANARLNGMTCKTDNVTKKWEMKHLNIVKMTEIGRIVCNWTKQKICGIIEAWKWAKCTKKKTADVSTWEGRKREKIRGL